jgi:hypothetical protein
MQEFIGFLFVFIALIINILATIISSSVVICLIWREWRLRDANLLLVINTYIAVLIWSAFQVFLNIHCILCDIHLYTSIDSIACHVRCYICLYVVAWFFYSFSLQAYLRMLSIVHPQRSPLRSLKMIMTLIIIICFVSFILVIPTIFLKVIVYESSEYQCVVDLRVWKGNVYMMLGFYSIPLTIIVTAYANVVKFMRESSSHIEQYRQITTMRNLRVLRRICIIVCALIILGLPSLILWIHAIITGHLQPLTYRIQALFLAFDIFILSFSVALTNSQVKRLLPFFNKQQTGYTITVHSQRQLANIPAQQL